MKKMAYQNVKGTNDYLPEQERVRRFVKRTLEDTFIQYGCEPLETPIVNYTSLLASKYAGGAEILKEMYTLQDQGKRDLALRYDLTIPFAKVVAMNPQRSLPFKRYEIGKVFRDGPIKAGRYREFTQCDVDIVGVESQLAEAELMMLAVDAFEKLNLDFVLQYNNRNVLAGLLQYFGVDDSKCNAAILIIDKKEKLALNELLLQLKDLQLNENVMEAIRQFLQNEPTIEQLEQFAYENELLRRGVSELKQLNGYMKQLNLQQICRFNPYLARGLEIYTGTIYELFLVNGTIRSSIGSGGRYDNAIAGLIGEGSTSLPTVGISFGLDVIYAAMAEMKEIASERNDIYIIPLNTEIAALQLAKQLRLQGENVEVELSGKKLRKAMEKANREGFPHVIVLGENEIENDEYVMRNMRTGEQQTYCLKGERVR